MDKRIIGFLPSAAFYVPALAAQVSGYTSSTVALVLAVIATVMLLVPACHHGSQWHQSRKSSARNGLDSWYFIAPCLVIGVVAFALAAYGLGLRSGTTVQVTNNNDLTAASPPLKEAVTDPSDIPRKIAVIDDARKLLRTEMEPAMNDGMRMFQSGQDALRKGDRNPLMKGLAEYFQTWAALWKKLEDFKKANDGFEDINSILDQPIERN